MALSPRSMRSPLLSMRMYLIAHLVRRGGREEGEEAYWLCLVRKVVMAVSYASVPSWCWILSISTIVQLCKMPSIMD